MALARLPRWPEGGGAKAILGALIFALAVALYLPLCQHEWINYDDDVYITLNPELALGLTRAGIGWAFTTFHGANWFPLTWLSWLADYQLYGLDPAGFHATNLLLHALDAWLLFLALSRMTGCVYRSAFVAAVFAVHPLHVESVAWAAARKDPLSGLFFMLVLLAYWGGAGRSSSPLRLLSVSALLALGLMAKPTLVTAPFALLLLDFWPLGRLRREASGRALDAVAIRRALVEKLPLFALVVAISAVVWVAQRSGGTVVSLEQLPGGARVANALVAYTAYLGKALWPSGLAVLYPHRGESLLGWQVGGAALLLLGLTALALRQWRRRPYLTVGWLWYLGTLVPVLGLVQVGSQAMADRYMYLPLIGLSIAAAWGASEVAGGERRRRTALAAAALATIAVLAACTAAQLRHWRDSASLFEHALAVTRDNHIAHAHLGAALLDRGETRAAISHLREAIRLRPDFRRAANNLAWVLATCDDPALRNPYLAVRLAERAARLSGPGDPAVLDTLAAAYASSGRFEDAARAARRGLEIAAGDAELAEALRARLALYESGNPFREAPSGGARAGPAQEGGR